MVDMLYVVIITSSSMSEECDSLDGMALGRLGTQCHSIIGSRSRAQEGARWLRDMRRNGVDELLLEMHSVRYGAPGHVGAALLGLEDGMRLVAVERRKAICGPPELALGRHRLVHPHVPRMAR